MNTRISPTFARLLGVGLSIASFLALADASRATVFDLTYGGNITGNSGGNSLSATLTDVTGGVQLDVYGLQGTSNGNDTPYLSKLFFNYSGNLSIASISDGADYLKNGTDSLGAGQNTAGFDWELDFTTSKPTFQSGDAVSLLLASSDTSFNASKLVSTMSSRDSNGSSTSQNSGGAQGYSMAQLENVSNDNKLMGNIAPVPESNTVWGACALLATLGLAEVWRRRRTFKVGPQPV